METIRCIGKARLCFVAQLVYEQRCGDTPTFDNPFNSIGVRLYQGADGTTKGQQYLCIDDPASDGEAWYRVDGVNLTAVKLDC